jgi:hypothetical protein
MRNQPSSSHEDERQERLRRPYRLVVVCDSSGVLDFVGTPASLLPMGDNPQGAWLRRRLRCRDEPVL